MKRKTVRAISTAIGCTLGGITFTGPLAGQLTADWQCRHGVCTHQWHWHRR